MNYISKVEIKDFWIDKKVVIEFTKGENFLIGVNGSGKTTVVNLIVSAISGNFNALDRIDFSKITIYFSPFERQAGKSKIVVDKSFDEFTGYSKINLILYKGNKRVREYFLNELEEDRLIRTKNRQYIVKTITQNRTDLKTEIKKLINISWLSIHRAKDGGSLSEDKTLQSFVDLKISDFAKDFTGYIAELTKKSNEQTDIFQKSIFLSLIETQSEVVMRSSINKIDIAKEMDHLSEVFKLFNLKESEYSFKIAKYLKNFETAKTKLQSSSVNFVEAEHLIGLQRIHRIIQKWHTLLLQQETIFSSQTVFLNLINELFQNKELLLNERNELYIKTQSGKTLSIFELSSGEKQLIILFGEALLQKRTPHIFIADEPELSLHIEWQEKLVRNLKLLNPFAQMIFATHSPDIVANYQSSVIKIESCIK